MKNKAWNASKEKEWMKLTKLRQEHDKEITKMHTIHLLEDLIESLKDDDPTPHEIKVEYLRAEFGAFALDALPPITGKRITLTYNGVPRM